MSEVVSREEIEKEVEYLSESARDLSNFYYRAKSQGAPIELLNEMALVWQTVENARQRLQSIQICFLSERESIKQENQNAITR